MRLAGKVGQLRISPRAGRRRDSRDLQQEDLCNAIPYSDDLQKAPESLPRPGWGRRKEANMNASKKSRLEQAGWALGDAADFLHLSEQESRFVELKLALAAGVREFRERRGLTQAALAERLGSS